MKYSHYQKLMNNTKWDEIRLSMYNSPVSVRWRTKYIGSNFVSPWDGEWYYHFREGGYKDVEWLEIEVKNDNEKNEVIEVLRKIHVPGEILDNTIKIFGYVKIGISVSCI